MSKYTTSESVTRGHPDKVCDQVGDAVLDEYLKKDADARVAIEVSATPETIVLSGEVRSRDGLSSKDRAEIVRSVIREVGYDAESGYDPDNLNIIDLVGAQSEEIAEAVDSDVLGAGDQGIMFGYATNETEEGLPLSLVLARAITNEMSERMWEFDLRPDGKSQVSVNHEDDEYSLTIVVSSQHDPLLELDEIRENLRRIVEDVLRRYDYEIEDVDLILQPAGTWNIGGPAADVGVLGRKIIVDSYGGAARHGGGAYSGKDPSKVDRSGAYAARQAALWLVKNGYADEAEVQLAYAIGLPDPVSVIVETFGTQKTDDDLSELLKNRYDFSVQGIIDRLDLTKPVYKDLAAFGHFGNDNTWEHV